MRRQIKQPLKRHWWGIALRQRWWIAGVVVFLVLVRLAMPVAIKGYVNKQLTRDPTYSGRIDDVGMALWRGAYKIHDIRIFKKTGEVRAPFFAASRLDLSIQWKELFHGSVVGEVFMDVSGATPAGTQTGEDVAWDALLKSLFPFKLNRLEIRRGQIRFQNEHSSPPVNIYVKGLEVVATNFTNSRNLEEELPAGVTARGTTIGGGDVELQVRMNPLATAPTFEMVCQVTNLDMVALNDFFKVYGKFDVESGLFGLYTSIASKEGTYEGYVKLLFENLDVFA